ncbi:MAG: GTPase Era [Clostridia bacterium]|nr:GTPase Era [Clostridia bacterium]
MTKEKEFRSGFAALVGRPNAGKSTLLNYMTGAKIAITSDKPQTTRNRIAGIINGTDYQLVLLDTPGIHKPKDKLGDSMVRLALNTLNETDVVFYLVDVTAPFGSGDAYLAEKLQTVETPVFLLLNKVDLLEKEKLLPLMDFYRNMREWQEIIPLSALKGDNVPALLQAALKYLTPGPRYYPEDTLTDQPESVLLAEIVREKVIEATRDEVPHAVAVTIEQLERRSEQLLYIAASIYVERDSQKGIIIGKNGERLKAIGSRARVDIERLLGSKTYLELFVRVKSDWRNKDAVLRELGYRE